MIEYKLGNLLIEGTEAIVNTVNCVGVMGRGIALQFKNAFPDNFKAYALACKNKEVTVGKMFVYETNQLTNPRYIINFPTKRHWKENSKIEDIEAGLVALIDVIEKYHIKSISIPPLGSGLGRLEWRIVKQLIEDSLQSIDINVVIFEPNGAPSNQNMAHKREIPKMTVGRAVLLELMQRYLNGVLDPFITLLEIHKLMYFMQAAGENLRLKFREAHYGPYAENLSHVLHAIEGHLIHGYSDGGDAPEKQIELVSNAIQDAEKFLESHQETRARFERVSQLVEGFESSFGLELLATVHWVITKYKTNNLDKVIQYVYDWNEHKRQFTERQVKIALDVLIKQSWV